MAKPLSLDMLDHNCNKLITICDTMCLILFVFVIETSHTNKNFKRIGNVNFPSLAIVPTLALIKIYNYILVSVLGVSVM